MCLIQLINASTATTTEFKINLACLPSLSQAHSPPQQSEYRSSIGCYRVRPPQTSLWKGMERWESGWERGPAHICTHNLSSGHFLQFMLRTWDTKCRGTAGCMCGNCCPPASICQAYPQTLHSHMPVVWGLLHCLVYSDHIR